MRRYLLILYDRDRELFSIVGPVRDDTKCRQKIRELRERGRDVSCECILADRSRDELIKEVELNTGYLYAENFTTISEHNAPAG